MKKFLVNLVWFIAALFESFEQPVAEDALSKTIEEMNRK